MILYHDVPSSKGVENGLKRARQFVEAIYTPIRLFPVCYKLQNIDRNGDIVESMSTEGLPLTGIVYSSVRRVEKYVGFNVSLETFYSALSNPNSALYHKRIEGTKQNVHALYGTVCSCFASYVLDLWYRTPCIRLPEVDGIEPVDIASFDELRLLDLVLVTKHHVAVITDLERDADGHVRYITVSESVLPQCRATRFSPEGFRAYWLDEPEHDYKFYRYAYLDGLTYTPSPFVPLEGDPCAEPEINRTLMPDYGNKANYRIGEEPVELSVFDPSFDTVAVIDPEMRKSRHPVVDGKVVLHPEKPGFYTAYCENGEKKSEEVAWCVTDFVFETDKDAYREGETIKIRCRSTADDPLVAWQFNVIEDDHGSEGGWLMTGTCGSGELTLTMPASDRLKELYLIAKNAYGCYTSKRVPVKGAE